MMIHRTLARVLGGLAAGLFLAASPGLVGPAQAQEKRPNVVMLMSDDAGWADFGAYLGGAALGHPTPNIDRIAKEGAMFTSWYGQASALLNISATGRRSSVSRRRRTSGSSLRSTRSSNTPRSRSRSFRTLRTPIGDAKPGLTARCTPPPCLVIACSSSCGDTASKRPVAPA